MKNGLFAEHPDDCPKYVHFALTARDKAQWPNDYEKGVRCFKALFQTGEERHRIALWNMVVNYYMPISKFCREDFSEEEYAFVKTASETCVESFKVNINPPMETERLVLRAVEGKDQKILAVHFKEDGDFAFFTGCKPTNKAIRQFTFCLQRSTFFAIERKSDRKLLGYIGLSIREESSTGLIEYYLFKEERRKGYCKEAVEVLTKRTLRGKLYEPVETVRLGVYRKRAIHMNAIRARISPLNTASQKTAVSCGFVHEATIHRVTNRGALGWTDQEIYYLTSEMIEC